MKIALIHDWILRLGGAERALKVLHEIFPKAPIYTLFYNKAFTNTFLPGIEIRTTFLQKLKKIIPHKNLAALTPLAIESLNLKEFDLVISSSISVSKGLVLKPKTKHICYCYSPTRWLWDWNSEYKSANNATNILRHFLRIWDKAASNRVDKFIATSKNVQKRIWKYYRRTSTVIYPPLIYKNFNLPKFQPASPKLQRDEQVQDWKLEILNTDYFLIVSQLFPHKNIGIAIDAFAKLNLPLVIIGQGPEFKNLKKKSKGCKNIKILGFVPDEELQIWYKNSLAFIMPQEEDFGLTALEAMSYGKPVLALRKGGALETVLENITGEFFDSPHPAVLANGVRKIKENIQANKYSPLVIQKWAEKFSKEKFVSQFKSLIHS